MKIIDTPTVYLVGRQQLDRPELARFLADHGVAWSSDSDRPAEGLTETAGRLCYMSFAAPRPGGNAAYLANILKSGHGSVFEHAVWNFVVTGVSRSLTHELVRHRHASYSQLSQRYVDEGVAEYVCPPLVQSCRRAYEVASGLDFAHKIANGLEGDLDAVWESVDRREAAAAAEFGGLPECRSQARIYKVWLDAVEHAHLGYVQLAGLLADKLARAGGGDPHTQAGRTELRKAARSAARSVLPNATETKVFVTLNARAARNAIELRCSRFADAEIRTLFGKLWEALAADSPALFSDYVKVPLADGTFELTTPYPKV